MPISKFKEINKGPSNINLPHKYRNIFQPKYLTLLYTHYNNISIIINTNLRSVTKILSGRIYSLMNRNHAQTSSKYSFDTSYGVLFAAMRMMSV